MYYHYYTFMLLKYSPTQHTNLPAPCLQLVIFLALFLVLESVKCLYILLEDYGAMC